MLIMNKTRINLVAFDAMCKCGEAAASSNLMVVGMLSPPPPAYYVVMLEFQSTLLMDYARFNFDAFNWICKPFSNFMPAGKQSSLGSCSQVMNIAHCCLPGQGECQAYVVKEKLTPKHMFKTYQLSTPFGISLFKESYLQHHLFTNSPRTSSKIKSNQVIKRFLANALKIRPT